MSSRHLDASRLTAYLEGEVTASERAAIEAELAESAEARRRLGQLRGLKSLLEAPATELETIDLAARVRVAVRAPVPAPPRAARARRWAALFAATLACLGSVALVLTRPRNDDAEFRAKSNGPALTDAKRWAGVQVFRVSAQGTPEQLGAHMSKKDGLLFSYTNLGTHPSEYLMIFAVDASGEVRWFYPAYERADTNPESIVVARDSAHVPLGALVQHDFASGPLSLYALFARQPLRVLEVEGWVKRNGRAFDEAPVPGGMLERFETTVTP
jgi:hypothetical protein